MDVGEDLTAEFLCQESIIHASVRAAADTILSLLPNFSDACSPASALADTAVVVRQMLTTGYKKTLQKICKVIQGARWDSNPRHSEPQSDALTN